MYYACATLIKDGDKVRRTLYFGDDERIARKAVDKAMEYLEPTSAYVKEFGVGVIYHRSAAH